MSNPWDRPSTGSPFRTGDYDADKIYLAVGKALSKWERLEGSKTDLYAAVIGTRSAGNYLDMPAVRAFGLMNSPATRADMIASATEATFHRLGFEVGINPVPSDTEELDQFENEIRDILKFYRGWMSRRNDIAHGYVRESQHPDCAQKGEPIVTSYSLFPSDGSSGKWCIVVGEPAYSYKADEIDTFGDAFESLDNRFKDFVPRFEKFRTELLPKVLAR